MNRRQVIGGLLAVGVIVANAAIWFAQQEPEGRITDSRATRRDQLVSQWDPLPVAPFDGVVGTLNALMEDESHLRLGRNAAGFGVSAAVRELDDAVRVNLAQAVGEALATIAANDPEQVIRYMAARGLEPHRPSLLGRLASGSPGDSQLRVLEPEESYRRMLWKKDACSRRKCLTYYFG